MSCTSFFAYCSTTQSTSRQTNLPFSGSMRPHQKSQRSHLMPASLMALRRFRPASRSNFSVFMPRCDQEQPLMPKGESFAAAIEETKPQMNTDEHRSARIGNRRSSVFICGSSSSELQPDLATDLVE